MPKLISQKNLRKSNVGECIISNSTATIQNSIDNISSKINNANEDLVGVAKTITKTSVVISSGVASVTSLSDPLTIIGL